MARVLPRRICPICRRFIAPGSGGWIPQGRRDVYVHAHCARKPRAPKENAMLAMLPYLLYAVGSLCFLAGSLIVLIGMGRR